MKYFLGFCVFSLVLLNHVFRATCFDSATAPGDIIIGGLFPIHESVNVTQRENGTESRMCDRFSIARLVQSLIMVQVVEEVNKRKEVGNLTLGYWIMDSCSDVTTALLNSLVFMKRSRPIPPPVLAVIGDYYSEISIAVARQLHLEYIPQISYGATSGLLSDKRRFPSFMRTVPEDDHQAQAIVHILQRHNWNWVGVVTTDSDYGRYIVQRFQKHATDKNICFAYTSVIPNDLGHKMLRESISAAVKSITENENATAIVSFARPHHMMYIFDELVKVPQGRGKVWVASDIWSESAGVLRKRPLNDIGKIFGTTLKSGSTTRLNQYLRNLDVNPEHHKNNTFLYKFLKEQEQDMISSHTSKNVTAAEILRENIHPYAALSVELAVRAVAQAVADLCANRDCKTTKRLDPVELRGALRNATFHLDGKNYSLDSRGDLDTGYDVILWRQTSPTYVDVHYIVAQYHINNDSLTFISQETFKDVISVTGDVISRCSNTCPPGYRKQSAHGQPTCCYECYACPADHFSNSSDSTECHECNISTHYSFRGSDRCIRKTIVFLHWKDVYHHVLQAFTALGALLTIAVGIIFLARWNTPVVRACVGPICILLLISLLGTFVSVIIFGGKPNNMQCQARQGLFALSFTLCVSCILVKSFKIILAFEFDPSVQRFLRKLYKPYIIIATCMAGQVLICALWFSLKPPERIWVVLKKKDELLLTCYETSFPAFGAMLGYIGFLALVCFGVAFKGRNLPESYNDAKFITFAMLIYFICWVIFGPVYVNVSGPYRQAVQMVVILISAYGILFCQFGVKCYIILFNQEANTVDAFRQDVRNYTMNETEGKDGKWDSFSVSSGGIQNTTLDLESSLWSSEQSINQIKSKSSDLSINAFSASSSGLFTLQQDRSKRKIRRYFSLQE